jgi:hypothetical protein
VTGNLAAFSDANLFLDFDKGSDARFIADLAAVQIDESKESDT